MCGIAGLIARHPGPQEQLLDQARQMASAITYRGPDSGGVWADSSGQVALGHRRLAIVDLSPQGAQPMHSACGRYTLIYNGEIYNHAELRKELAPHDWRGHSDTETMLAGFSRWGISGTLGRLIGMFAIAVWDHEHRQLILARDRMGEKPLYYGQLPCGDFVFGSELKALRAHPRWQAEIDRNALALYMRHNAVPAPHSIYRGIFKLMPGHWLTLKPGEVPQPQAYWSLEAVAKAGREQPSRLSDAEATGRLESLLKQVIGSQMVADVPLGAFLSGGIDSSTITALMQAQSTRPVRTFSIGFDADGYDEAVHAKAVAAHLGTDHTELYVSPADALAVIPRLPTLFDEPFADSSQIPTFLVSQMARRHVTVALSGDAGDELFAGYNRYLLADRVWHKLSRIPVPLRQAAAALALQISPAGWDRVRDVAAMAKPSLRNHAAFGDKIHKFAGSVLPSRSIDEMYRALVSHWQRPSELVLGSVEASSQLDSHSLLERDASPIEQMCLLDQLTYLPDDILAKVDRAAMACSLETRVPFLDHRVVEFAWQLPMSMKLRDGQGKWLLRQVLYRHVPRELIDRPKQGFSVPLDQWLRGPLRDWAENLLAPERLRSQGLLNVAQVRAKWQEHVDGRRNWQHLLWDVLMLQAWIDAAELGSAA